MDKQDVLNDLIKIFESNKNGKGFTNVNGVYKSLKEYMLKLKMEIELEIK